MQLDKPNLVLPLASSYNERGMAGFTNTFTNALDQRRINAMYEVAKNALTGKVSLTLVKRPGTSIATETFGTSGQVGYLVFLKPGATDYGAASHWVFSVSGSDVRASDSSGTTTILTAANNRPFLVDKTAISGAETLVLQTINASFMQRVWFSTAIGTFTEITDGDFTALTHKGKMEHLDGFALILTSTNRIYNADLNSLVNWTASNFITKQIVQDIPLGLMRLGSQILAFGAETMEVFVNAGNATGSPLRTVPELSRRVGISDPAQPAGKTSYYAVIDNRLYFHGQIGGGRGAGLFMYDGSKIERVSTQFIDKMLEETAVYGIWPVSVSGQEGVAVALDLVTATTQRWLMFFPRLNEWFEWNSTVVMPINSGQFCLGVGSNQHRLYDFVVTDTYQDNGTNYQWLTQFMLPSDGNHVKFMAMCGVIGDVARSAESIAVSFSDDDYQTWSTARNIDLTSNKPHIYRCGSFKKRAVRLSYTGANDVRLQNFVARVN